MTAGLLRYFCLFVSI